MVTCEEDDLTRWLQVLNAPLSLSLDMALPMLTGNAIYLQSSAFGVLILSLIVLALVSFRPIRSQRRLPLPPGPPRHWLTGNEITSRS